jgi:hypothetical protein
MLKESWFSLFWVSRVKSMCTMCDCHLFFPYICLLFPSWFSVRISFPYMKSYPKNIVHQIYVIIDFFLMCNQRV